MSQSLNVIDLRKWLETRSPSSGTQLGNFSNSMECIELLHAFTRIGNPAFRLAIIRVAESSFLTPRARASRRRRRHSLKGNGRRRYDLLCQIASVGYWPSCWCRRILNMARKLSASEPGEHAFNRNG